MKISRAILIFIALTSAVVLPARAFGETVALAFEKECDFKSDQFVCKPSSTTVEIYFRDGKWYGINGGVIKDTVPLGIIRDDKYVLILNNPMNFSGASIVHVMKATGRFYWTEIAYSEILKADETHVRIGRIIKK